jgi:NAD(P)-dependent dehydrogenase (short-subunit alcohol dehydrogenase family)
MEKPKPTSTQIPTEDQGYQTYKAAGKLDGKRAIITGGDSGIGRAVAILFAMEGASSLITYLPEEEKDAQETKRRVEEAGQKCYTLAVDLRTKENCRKVIDTALEKLGGIDTLVNNAGYQNMIQDIGDLDEYVPYIVCASGRVELIFTPAETSGNAHSTRTSTPSFTYPSTHFPI